MGIGSNWGDNYEVYWYDGIINGTNVGGKMKPIIAGNWKMNLEKSDATELIKNINNCMSNHTDINLLIFPSYCYLDMAKSLLTHGDIGAQNISEFAEGAYTGEISAKMVKSCGATYALLGHSECRHVFFETEDMIQKKIVLCNEHGLTPMLCVREKHWSNEMKDMYKP